MEHLIFYVINNFSPPQPSTSGLDTPQQIAREWHIFLRTADDIQTTPVYNPAS